MKNRQENELIGFPLPIRHQGCHIYRFICIYTDFGRKKACRICVYRIQVFVNVSTEYRFFVCEMNKEYIYINNVLCVGLHFYVYGSKPPRSKRLVSAIIKSIGTVFVRYYISLNKYVAASC